ncbi:hypothetical protein GCM10010503_25650 [Streptomyces lucensis JCM 4490]|uniref:Uncharacterized protein n=1 Tax=Streptomyces lucensis JCM 4490 TaxID=1306176 RepID=A0A918J7Q1_9ACTN|nr:hypothetical protein [Streptomyces lucensis]GGW47648.1 hypothetical protein GCM10010503_25650 [Streptomyces lucensis JCM 4490]
MPAPAPPPARACTRARARERAVHTDEEHPIMSGITLDRVRSYRLPAEEWQRR